MNYYTLREVQLAEFDILCRFDDFCKEHDISYSLVGGTLLGAVRHKGFIPWDDDIDVMVSRVSFDWIAENKSLFEESTGLVLVGYCGSDLKDALLYKITNPKIAASEEALSYCGDLFIDLFPVDGLPSDFKATEEIYRIADHYRLQLARLVSVPEASQSPIKRSARRVLVSMPFINRLEGSLGKRLTKVCKGVSYGSTDYVGLVTWGIYGPKMRMKLSDFENIVMLEFEGREFPAISSWEEYLTACYGNYMKLPPESEQINHHYLTVWDK